MAAGERLIGSDIRLGGYLKLTDNPIYLGLSDNAYITTSVTSNSIDIVNLTGDLNIEVDNVYFNVNLLTASGLLKYSSDLSAFYDNRTLVDKGYVDNSLLNITTLGTVTTGIWNANIISPQYGGTGINNGIKTITLGGNFTTTGSYNTIFSQQFSGVITLPNATSVLATTTLSEFFSNKTLDNTNTLNIKDSLFTLEDNLTTGKKVKFELINITNSTTRTLEIADFDGVINLSDGNFKTILSTTDDTVTPILIFETVNDTIYHVETTVIYRKISGTGTGSINDSGSFTRTGTVKNIGGVLTLIGTQSTYTYNEILDHNVFININSIYINVEVRGTIDNNVDWISNTKIIKL
jgi:hypothetical protein